MRSVLLDAVGFAGLALLLHGVGTWSIPAAEIVGGVLLIGVAYRMRKG